MRVAISNIAWPTGADPDAADLLREGGAEGVEVAPTKIWPEPLAATARERLGYRSAWEDRKFPIVALQALLFGKPGLTLFGSAAARRACIDYLKGMIRLAADLGAGALVFGSPKNRIAGSLPAEEVMGVAVPFFRELGDAAAAQGVSFCIEPNPAAYGCDFVTTTAEAIDLVDAVGSEGFAVHLDTGGMQLSGDPYQASVRRAGDRCRHFHASGPYLREVRGGEGVHAECAAALRSQAYRGWVSVEMSEANLQPSWREGVARSLAFARTCYGDDAQGPGG